MFLSDYFGIRGGVGEGFVGEILNKNGCIPVGRVCKKKPSQVPKIIKRFPIIIILHKTPIYLNGLITIDPSGRVSWGANQ